VVTTFLQAISDHKLLLIPAAAWFISQAVKLITVLVRQRSLDFSYLWSMGGMPSAHSALVCSLAAGIAIRHGFDSALFALAFFFAIIVMYDASGVRKTVGVQSTMLNKILDELFKGRPLTEQRVKEIIGHSHLEVFVGALLGILLALWWM
jgi:acid phosphatase family membrane protein YuiD